MIFTIIVIAVLAFYVAWNLGANDVANSMGTSVGSKAITLRQAIIIAGVLEFTGAVVFGENVANTIATKVINPDLFIANPFLLLLGMVSVLISCGLWLQIATFKGLPVASSHCIIGGIAGMSFIQGGIMAVDWQNLGAISLGWIVTPLVSALIAAIFYLLITKWILEQKYALRQLKEWIPWLSVLLFSVFGIIVFPTILEMPFFEKVFTKIPNHNISLVLAGIAIFSLSINSFSLLKASRNLINDKFEQKIIERVLGRFQVISASFVAFAHGSNDVGNAIAPLAVIAYILKSNQIPNEMLTIPKWTLIIGGLGLVVGLAVQGKRVIATIGEGIIVLKPSKGFSAEIATAITILAASSLGFPVSTSHALIGAVVGIGLVKNREKLQLDTVKSVVLAWTVTLPVTALIGATTFSFLKLIFSNFS